MPAPPLPILSPACRCAWLGVAIALLLGVGCEVAPVRVDDPVAVMVDREAYPDARLAAADQAEEELQDDPQRLEALQALLTEPGHGHRWQVYALHQLAEVAPDRAIALLAEYLHSLDSWTTVQHALDLAVEHDWRELTPAIVRRYAVESRRFADDARPERAALVSLHTDAGPQALEADGPLRALVAGRGEEEAAVIAAAYAVFTGEVEAPTTGSHRAGGYVLLHRLVRDRDRLMVMLDALDADDALIADLQAAAGINILPDNLETVAWLRMLRSGIVGDLWPRAAAIAARLDPAQQEGLALRHLPVLAYVARVEPAVFERTFSDLYDELERRLATAETHARGETVDARPAPPEDIAHWRDHLAWADLVTIRLMMQLMEDRRLVGQWFEQADADLADTTSEHGGLIRVERPGREPREASAPRAARGEPAAHHPSPPLGERPGEAAPGFAYSTAFALAVRAIEPPSPRLSPHSAWLRGGRGVEKAAPAITHADDGPRVVLELYEPAIRRHAKAYYPPVELIVDGYTALAHYHFHAYSHKNARAAGPSEGDLRTIGDRQQFNAIVLTFIDRDRLNVDYYQPNQVVVDLGTIER